MVFFQRPFRDGAEVRAPGDGRGVRGQVQLQGQVRRGLLGRDPARDRHAGRLQRLHQDRPPQGRLPEQARDHPRAGVVSLRIKLLSVLTDRRMWC